MRSRSVEGIHKVRVSEEFGGAMPTGIVYVGIGDTSNAM